MNGTRLSNRDLKAFLDAGSKVTGDPPPPFRLAVCFAVARELLRLRRELRILRGIVTDQNLWPLYRSRLAQARGGRKK